MKEDKRIIIHPIIGGEPHTCIHCDKKIVEVTNVYNYPSGKHAHLNCHIENNGGKI
ncbi:TPA: hypothetical protein ACGXM3_005230 [Bacillus cereus]